MHSPFPAALPPINFHSTTKVTQLLFVTLFVVTDWNVHGIIVMEYNLFM